MDEIQLTEADIGKRFRLKGGEVVTVSGFDIGLTYPVDCSDDILRSENGLEYLGHASRLDIVERLDPKPIPIEEVITIDDDDAADKPQASGTIWQDFYNPEHDDPPQATYAGSDGKQYPAEWFAVQQRFDEHTPPEYAQLRIESFEGAPIGRAVFDNNFLTVGYEDSTQQVHLDQIYDQWTWTIASAPPKPKPVPNIWDEYKTPCGKGVLPEFGEPIFEKTICNNPKRYKAVSEYILHILSQGDAT